MVAEAKVVPAADESHSTLHMRSNCRLLFVGAAEEAQAIHWMKPSNSNLKDNSLDISGKVLAKLK